MESRVEPTFGSLPDPARRLRTRIAIPLAGAVALLPFANGRFSVALAAWLAPIFLLRLTRSWRRASAALGAAWTLSTGALMFQFRGMVPFPAPIYAAVMLTYGFLFAVPYLLDRRFHARLPIAAATLVFPSAWAGIEFLMSRGPFGSWFSAGYSQAANPPLLQMLSVTGLWGLTFLIGWTAATANAFIEARGTSRRAPAAAFVCGGVLALVLLAGGARLALFPPSSPTIRVASLSGIDLPLHPDPRVVGRFFDHATLAPAEVATIRERAAAIDDDLLLRSQREARAGAKIVFWGETNAPVMKDDEDALDRRAGALSRREGIYLGMGLASWHLESVPPLENKLVLVGPDGRVAWEYWKAHPVPGPEAMMSRGSDGRLRFLDSPYGRISSIVCFDADFPHLLAQAGRLGADIVLDPSNDWRAIDPWHTRMASFRAIEQGVNLVRQTSRGLSAAYDYEGRTLAAMDHYTATDRALVAQVPTRGVRTVYTVLGDWAGWASLVALAVLILPRRKRLRPAV
jgi:apolipoprotein N-acyltransferase